MSKKPSKSNKSPALQLGRAVGMAGCARNGPARPRCPIRRRGTDYLVRFTVPEFTSLCPVNHGQLISPISMIS